MKAAIFGAGNAGRFLYDEFVENAKEIKIVGFLDRFLKGDYKGIKIYHPNDFLKIMHCVSSVFT